MGGYLFPCLLFVAAILFAALAASAAVGLTVLGVRTVAWLLHRAPAPWALIRSVAELEEEHADG